MIERVSIIRFGNLKSAPQVCASISNFFGERELELYCWDPDSEPCEIMCRVLRYFLKTADIRNFVYSKSELNEALENSAGIILCADREEAEIDEMLAGFSHLPIYRVPPDESVVEDSMKFQCLRWINKEDYPSEYLYAHRNDPLIDWLNRITTRY